MSNYKFQKDLSKRIFNVGSRRIMFNIPDQSSREKLKNSKTRKMIKELVSSKIIVIKPGQTTKRKSARIKHKRPDRKRQWIARVRSLRAHWKNCRKVLLNKKSLSELQKSCLVNLGVDSLVYQSKPKLAIRMALKKMYLKISQNKVKNRNYLFGKLGLNYEEVKKCTNL